MTNRDLIAVAVYVVIAVLITRMLVHGRGSNG